PSIGDRVFAFRSAVERMIRTRQLFAAVAGWNPDLAYLRYDLFAPPPATLVRRLKTVIEVNSDTRAELSARGRGASVYGRVQDALVQPEVAGAVCVTHELARDLRRRVVGLEPRVIANGIRLDEVQPVPRPAHVGPPRLVYLGDDVYWQGLDKVFELAA